MSDDLISRQSLYDKMREAEELAQKRVIDTRKTSSDGSINPIYAIYKTQLNERTRFKEMIYDEPSADAVEIVRCKDCRWWNKSKDSPFGYCMAIKHGYMSANWEIGIYRKYKGDFYCADGEKG